MNEIGFLRPLWLLACLPLAWCWGSIFVRARKSRDPWNGVVDAHLLPHILIGRSNTRQRGFWLAALALAWFAVVLALAGPHQGSPVAKPGVAAQVQVFLIEIPASAGLPADVARQWESARQAARTLLGQLPNRETAVVLYSRHPFLLIPPTTDRESVDQLLQGLRPGLLPEYGARPELARALAEEMRERNRFGPMDIYWLTAGDIVPANDRVPPGEGRASVFYYGSDTSLADKLQAFARGTGGVYVAPSESLAPDSLPAFLAPDEKITSANEVTPHELGPALILLILPLAIFAFRPAVFVVLLATTLGLGLFNPEPAFAENRQAAKVSAGENAPPGSRALAAASFVNPCWRAVANYHLGRYPEAAALWDECPGADAAFNRGNALARAGRLHESVEAYDHALRLRPDDEDFLFNRNIVQAILKPPSPPPPKPSTLPPGSPSSEASQMPSTSPREEKLFAARKLSENAARSPPESEHEFLRRLILLRLNQSCKMQPNARINQKYC